MNSQAVVCGPEPISPPGANSPGNDSAWATTMPAVNRYPHASTSRARERRIENWANSSAAVISSLRVSADW